MLNQARALYPDEPEIEKTEKLLQTIQQKSAEGEPQQLVINPPPPDWLDYLLDQKRSPELRRQIIELSKKADLNDPIIQLEAMIVEIEENNYKNAGQYIAAVSTCLGKFSFANAACCEVLAQNGEAGKAIQAGIKAITLDPKSDLAWKKLALAYALKGDETLDPRFSGALERNPSLAAMFYYNLGLYKAAKNKTTESLALFEKSLKAEPRNPDLYIEYARGLINNNDPAKSIEVLHASLKYKTDNPETYTLTGLSCMKTGKTKEGIEAFQTAIKIDPKNYYTHFYLGHALKQEGRVEEALSEFQRSLVLKPDFEKSLYQIGIIYFQFKNFDKAIPAFEEMLRIDPKMKEIYSLLIEIYTAQGKTSEVQSVTERAQKAGIDLIGSTKDRQKQ